MLGRQGCWWRAGEKAQQKTMEAREEKKRGQNDISLPFQTLPSASRANCDDEDWRSPRALSRALAAPARSESALGHALGRGRRCCWRCGEAFFAGKSGGGNAGALLAPRGGGGGAGAAAGGGTVAVSSLRWARMREEPPPRLSLPPPDAAACCCSCCLAAAGAGAVTKPPTPTLTPAAVARA